ncbi:MAG: hypothetical protein IBX70_11715 [Clostridia bacterium]|nr:hypothetical protein [Clostridia bacterium]
MVIIYAVSSFFNNPHLIPLIVTSCKMYYQFLFNNEYMSKSVISFLKYMYSLSNPSSRNPNLSRAFLNDLLSG